MEYFLRNGRKFSETRAIAIEPSEYIAKVCRNKGLEIYENIAKNVEGIDRVADLVVCFKVGTCSRTARVYSYLGALC